MNVGLVVSASCVAGVLSLAGCGGGAPTSVDPADAGVGPSAVEAASSGPTVSAPGMSDIEACNLIRQSIQWPPPESFEPVVEEISQLAAAGMKAADAYNWHEVVRTLRTMRRSAEQLPEDLKPAGVDLRTEVQDACSDQRVVDEFIQLNHFIKRLNQFRNDVSTIPKNTSQYRDIYRSFGLEEMGTFPGWAIDTEGFIIPPGGWKKTEFFSGRNREIADGLNGSEGLLDVTRDSEMVLDLGTQIRGGS